MLRFCSFERGHPLSESGGAATTALANGATTPVSSLAPHHSGAVENRLSDRRFSLLRQRMVPQTLARRIAADGVVVIPNSRAKTPAQSSVRRPHSAYQRRPSRRVPGTVIGAQRSGSLISHTFPTAEPRSHHAALMESPIRSPPNRISPQRSVAAIFQET
jgi:hypothetical protein